MKQYIAVVSSGSTSGFKANRQDAINWAQDYLGTSPKTKDISICEVVAVVERIIAPIMVRDLSPSPAASVEEVLQTAAE